MSIPLSDKTIFITGSGGVLGTAYVNTLLENGATVVASDLPGLRADAMKERYGAYANFAYYDLGRWQRRRNRGYFPNDAGRWAEPKCCFEQRCNHWRIIDGGW